MRKTKAAKYRIMNSTKSCKLLVDLCAQISGSVTQRGAYHLDLIEHQRKIWCCSCVCVPFGWFWSAFNEFFSLDLYHACCAFYKLMFVTVLQNTGHIRIGDGWTQLQCLTEPCLNEIMNFLEYGFPSFLLAQSPTFLDTFLKSPPRVQTRARLRVACRMCVMQPNFLHISAPAILLQWRTVQQFQAR